MSAPQYSFPILKYSDILSCLKELGIALTLDELSNPTAEAFEPVWMKLIELLKGVTKDDFRQPAFHAIDTLSYPELHEESLGQVGVYRELLELCSKNGVSDITLRDFTEPDKGRTKKILSAIINFAKFREDKLEYFTQFIKDSEELYNTKNNLEVENQSLVHQYHSATKALSELEPSLSGMNKECDGLKTELNTLMNQQVGLREEIKTQKVTNQSVLEELEQERHDLSLLEEENHRLKSQIIPDPAKLKHELNQMNDTILEKRQEVASCLEKLRLLQSKTNSFDKIHEKLKKRIHQLQSLNQESSALSKLKRSNTELLSQLNRVEEEMSEMSEKENTMKRNINTNTDKLCHLQKNLEQKRMTASLALEQVNSEKQALLRLIHQQKSKMEENESLLILKKQQLEYVEKEHSRIMNSLRSKYMTLQSSVNQYHANLTQLIQRQE